MFLANNSLDGFQYLIRCEDVAPIRNAFSFESIVFKSSSFTIILKFIFVKQIFKLILLYGISYKPKLKHYNYKIKNVSKNYNLKPIPKFQPKFFPYLNFSHPTSNKLNLISAKIYAFTISLSKNE